jgi:hypothetical protein
MTLDLACRDLQPFLPAHREAQVKMRHMDPSALTSHDVHGHPGKPRQPLKRAGPHLLVAIGGPLADQRGTNDRSKTSALRDTQRALARAYRRTFKNL